VRVYTVREGDTPSSIAARDDMAGCRKCARDLILANPQRPHVQHPNGWLSFRTPLVPGEQLVIPEKWGDGTLDRLSKEYFASLPADPTGLGSMPSGDLTMNQPSQSDGAYPIMLRPDSRMYQAFYGVGDAPVVPAPSTVGVLLAKLPSWWPFAGIAVGGVMALTGLALLASGGRKAASNPRKPGDHRYWVKLARMGRIPIWASSLEKAQRAAGAHANAYRTEVESIEGPDDPATNPRKRTRSPFRGRS